MPFFEKPQIRALSSIDGKIDQVLIVVPGNTPVELARALKSRRGIWEALDDRVKFVVYGHTEDCGPQRLVAVQGDQEQKSLDKTEMEYLINRGNWQDKMDLFQLKPQEQCPKEGYPNLQEYAQDPFVVKSDGKKTVILESTNNPQVRNRFIAEDICSQSQSEYCPSELLLQGGNLLFGNDYAIVGADCFATNLELFGEKQPGISREQLKERFKKDLGVEYLIVPEIQPYIPPKGGSQLRWGDGHQAQYHIDLYTTLGGKHPHRNEQVIFIGELVAYWDPEKPDSPKSQIQWLDQFHLLKSKLDETAEFFREYRTHHHKGPRFRVVRVPLIWEFQGASGAILRTYNNCLAQTHKGKVTFFLPQYDDHLTLVSNPRSHEQRVRDMFSSYGANVVWVRGHFSDLAQKAASLHCIIKVLHRIQD